VAQLLADAVLHALRWLQTAGPTDLFKTVPVAPWITDRSVYLGAMEKLREAFPRDALIHEEAVLHAGRQHARVGTALPGGRAYSQRLFTNAFVSRSRPRTAG
jgi:NitT/TauT family transport system substrate-binding protein